MDSMGKGNGDMITTERLHTLPGLVQRYMQFSGVIGQPWIDTIFLKQTGRFRRAPDQPWMPVTAEQTFTTDPPSFVWNARFKVAGLPMMRARDSYRDAHGHMYGKLAGLINIFDARGLEIDQGTMLRYLGEMVWFPTAFLGSNMTWQAMDDSTAQVTFTDGGRSVSARMTFADDGRPSNFNAQRYGDFNGKFVLASWSVPVTHFEPRAGLVIPVRGQVVWNLSSGDFAYYDWEIGEVEYNRPLPNL